MTCYTAALHNNSGETAPTMGSRATRSTGAGKAVKSRQFRELTPAHLRWTCRPSQYDFKTKETDASLIGIVGQERAIRSLKLGIELYAPGYNVFVCGITGTGRLSTVQKILDHIKGFCPLPPDRCYVNNAASPDEPRLLVLPRGQGAQLRASMERFGREIQHAVPSLLESEAHTKHRERIVSRYEGEADTIIEKFERRAERQGFALKRVREGNISRPELFPIIEGQAIPMADLEKVAAEGKIAARKAESIARQYQTLRQDLEVTARQSRDLLARMESEISDLEKKEVRALLQVRLDAIAARFTGEGHEVVAGWLRDVQEEIVAQLSLFRRAPAAGTPVMQPNAPPGLPASMDGSFAPGLAELLSRLQVNVIFDARKHGSCPIIVETHPTYRRLFGAFEKAMDQSGHWSTDYMRIRAGSLLAADGGYLVVSAEDLFQQREVWTELKRCMISRSLAIMEESGGAAIPTITMKPQPIPINVKVIMIGLRETYETLLENEPDFQKMFKVLADFDDEMDLSEKTIRQYAAFVRRVCTEEGLADLDDGAMAAVAEYGARLAGHQGKLSSRLGEIADLLREGDYWRRHDGASRRTQARHLRTAIKESIHRRNLSAEKLREMVRLGQIFIETKGTRVGQVNGMTVHHAGGFAFGLPCRITATVSPGTAGIVNIEREARLSGSVHTKGVLIIGGFLRGRFGARKPVTLTAGLAFEQSYGGVEGDSASSTEVYALLSALAGVPVRQGIAVTGSVDQIGDIQPVGGLNEKIEGFFRICQLKGLTGDQGFIVPEANLRDLMLNDDVIEAVKRRKFHIYPVRTVEDAIEILTLMPAGCPDPSGTYPEGTLFRLVDDRLSVFNEMVRRYFPSAPL